MAQFYRLNPVVIIILLSILTISNAYAQVVSITPNTPVWQETLEVLPRYSSSINIDASIALSDIYNLVNAEIPPNISGHQGIDIGGPIREERVEYYLRRENIIVEGNANGLTLRLPISGSVSLKGCIDVFKCIDFSETGHVSGNIVATISNISLNEAWQLQMNSHVEVQITEAYVNVVGNSIHISVRGEVQDRINRMLPEITRTLQQKLQQSLRIKERLEQEWQEVNTTEQIHDTPAAWIQFKPEQVFMSPLRIDNSQIHATFGVRADVQTFMGRQPEALAPIPLPALSPAQNSDFHIRIPALVSLESLNELLRPCCLEQELQASGINFIFRNIKLAGANNQLLVEAEFTAQKALLQAEGKIFLTATPEWDAATGILHFREVDFHTETENALLQAAGWLIEKPLLNVFADTLYIDLSDTIEELKEEARSEAQNLAISDELTVTIDPSHMAAEELRIYDNNFIVVVAARGTADAYISITP